jgi:DNA replication and repair protein RecF
MIKLGYLPRLDRNGNGPQNGEELARVVENTAILAESAVGAVARQLRQKLATGSAREVALGRTDAGPHLDDWRLWVNGRALDAYGSRGQQRTAMLALKLAEIEWMTRVTGETPILLLDEVMAELDDQRRELLLTYVQKGAQALLTATDLDMFSGTFLERATTMRVSSGRITPSTSPIS